MQQLTWSPRHCGLDPISANLRKKCAIFALSSSWARPRISVLGIEIVTDSRTVERDSASSAE